MGVVARLNVNSIEIWPNTRTIKMTPAVPSDDPHDEEIKAFFAATPSGSVELSISLDNSLARVEPGEQVYLYLTDAPAEGGLINPWAVASVRLDGWATYVELTPKSEGRPHSSYSNSKIAFTIRNELAAEQFQPAAEFYVRLEKVSV